MSAEPTELRFGATLRFSVIIPTWQCAEKLAKTLASLWDEEVEIVVIDGGSTDQTLEILRRSGERIQWVSEPDCGIYDAMNKGIALAKGRYLLFLGAGDEIREGALEKVVQVLPVGDDALVYGNALMHDKGVVWDGPWHSEKFRKRNICHQAIFYGRDIFSRLGGFDVRFSALADYAMNIRCFGDSEIRKIYLDAIITDYEGNGFSAKTRDEFFYAQRDALLESHLGLPRLSPKVRKERRSGTRGA